MTSSLSPFPPLSAIITKVVMSYILKKKISYEFPPRVFHFLLIQKEKSVCSSVFFSFFFFKVWTFSTACLPTMTRGREMNAGSRHCTEHRHTQIIQYSPWCEVSVVPPTPWNPVQTPPQPPVIKPLPQKNPSRRMRWAAEHVLDTNRCTQQDPQHSTNSRREVLQKQEADAGSAQVHLKGRFYPDVKGLVFTLASYQLRPVSIHFGK